ncbi:MAG TPA: IPT/TIG domain-containing protein, partial [Bacteroidales bacterium]|nr:IPT/TIG domain-containing protein [Bacteroidales bacterium]
MRTHKKITIPGLIILLVLAVFASGCEESAPLSIDPVQLDAPFTFSPLSGHPGQIVAITGKGLADVTRVSFSTRGATIVSKTNEEIRVEIPVGALTGRIKLIRPNSVTSSITEFRVDPVPVPNIIGFTPAIVGRNQPVAITGNLLDQVDSVYVGTLRAVITAQTATTLNITTPAAMVSGPIRLYYDFLTEFGFLQVREAVSATQLSLALPVINSITPDISALDVGTVVTINGTMMDAVSQVRFGTVVASFTIVSPTQLTATVPAGATTGRIVLTVPDGTTQSESDFRVILPAISNFFPQKGAEIVGGTRDITLTGTGFDRVTEARLGTTPVTIMAQTATNITVRIGGSMTGIINLVTANGIVGTGIPFIITGDFWLVDFDRTFSPQRFTSSGWDQVNATVQALTSVPSGGARGNFGSTTA